MKVLEPRKLFCYGVMMTQQSFYWYLEGDSQETVLTTSNEIAYWCKSNCKDKYDIRFTYDVGDPVLAVYFREPRDAMLFKLTFYESS